MLAAKILTACAGAVPQLYVDDVFGTYARTGTAAELTVTTNINMTEGYMVWSKSRGEADHAIYDSARGVTLDLATNSSAAQTTQAQGLKSTSATGHTWGTLAKINTNSVTYVDWIFRKANKFFDVVTYTGNGANRAIAHNLGVAPGMILVKRTDNVASWMVYHRSLANTENLVLNASAPKATNATAWNSTTATASEFSLGTHVDVNANAGTYVAYLFAHDAGAAGIIQAGSFTTNASGNATITLGWEIQYALIKVSSTSDNWIVVDSIRGMPVGGNDWKLYPNLSGAEVSGATLSPTATGFDATGAYASETYIYLAVRRPNKPPTSGTQVYAGVKTTGTGNQIITSGFPVDHTFNCQATGATNNKRVNTRLRNSTVSLYSNLTSAEGEEGYVYDDHNTGLRLVGWPLADAWMWWMFKRAPGVFDVVCDTGTGSAHTLSHNLNAAPELIIRKGRSGATQWEVYCSALANTEKLVLDSTAAKATDTASWNSTSPTPTVFTVGTGANVNTNTATYVTCLFSTLAGISKIGSYTGNDTNQTIGCGFTTGARFIIIKRTDSTGDWYVWDSVRGIVAGNDPHLNLNTTAVEITTDDSIDPDSTGFIVNQLTATNINVASATYIFLAIS
jgi:hypothetical protein